MEFIDYNKRIQDNRENIIEYYVKQYGADKRKMFEERFNKIKFCFWINPDMLEDYIEFKYRELCAFQIADFINKTIRLKGDEINLEVVDGRLKHKNNSIKYVIESLFGPAEKLASFPGEPVRFEGIWSFLEDLSETNIESLMNIYNDGKEAKINKEEFILSERCNFFRKMGNFPQEMSDETIQKSEKYDELVRKYCKLAKLSLEYKKRAEEPLKEMVEYLEIQQSNEKELKDDKMAIAKSRIIGGNYTIESEDYLEYFFNSEEQQCVTNNENGIINEVVIFFNPFLVPSSLDNEISLRHEIRHAMMTSSNGVKDGKAMIKTGNLIITEDGEELRTFNEYITQKDAIEETESEVRRGISLLTDDITSIEKSIEYKCLTKYMSYFPVGNIVISQEPLISAVRKSQIAEKNNNDLYNVISLEQLHTLEELMQASPLISKTDINRLRNLMQELGIQDIDRKIKEQYGYLGEEPDDGSRT